MNAAGRAAWGNDFETGARLQESYAKAGKGLAVLLKSKSKNNAAFHAVKSLFFYHNVWNYSANFRDWLVVRNEPVFFER
jgi:hypothetical protein